MMQKFTGILVACLIVCAQFGYAQEIENQEPEMLEDKTLSPYFVVLTDDPELDQLPLKSTTADVDIAGVIANVKVTQVYENHGERPIEAIYVFPLSTNAAVYSMQMTIGDKLIKAQIKEREEARQEYEEAKEEGKSASLLEQNRPNVFQMNVANVMPGDTIVVELEFVELLVPENGIYEFVYPAVVGPRYSELKESEAGDTEQWIETPYQHEGEDSFYDFNVITRINAGMPLQTVESPSHDIVVSKPDEQTADIVLSTTERAGLKDYELQYNLRGDEIETGALLYEGEDENFFLVMVEPPQQVEERDIPPREYLFVIDVSGSMRGFPLDVAQEFLNRLLTQLRPNDVFNVIAFSGGSHVMFENSVPATSENIQKAVNEVEQMSGGGGTRLLEALQRVFNLPLYSEELSRSTVVITDGYIGAEYDVFDEIRAKLNISNVFAAGIGSSPNRFLIEGMARTGQGQPLFISQQNEVQEKIEQYTNYIKEPLLTHIEVDYDGFDAYETEPPSVPDVFAQRPIILFGKYNGDPNGTISIAGQTANGPYETSIDLSTVEAKEDNVALRYLWARKLIQQKSDYVQLYSSEELVEEITQLGLKYNLLTPYTSFIAVYHEIRNEDGELVVVEQPLPLPEGVEDSAIGGGPERTDAAVGVSQWGMHEQLRLGDAVRGRGVSGGMGGMAGESIQVSPIERSGEPEPNKSIPLSEIPAMSVTTYEATVIEIVDPITFKVRINGTEYLVQVKDLELVDNEAMTEATVQWLNDEILNQTITIVFEDGIQPPTASTEPQMVTIQWKEQALSKVLLDRGSVQEKRATQ